MKQEDLNEVKKVLNNKRLYNDNPSCGFNENVSIEFNNKEVFYIACDGCPIVYYKKENKYLKLSEEENTVVREIVEKYGFYFPCV